MPYHRIRDMLRTDTPDGSQVAKLDVDRLELSYERVKPGAMAPEQSFDRPQIVYILSGTMEMSVGGESRTVHAGDVWLIDAGTPQSYQASGAECIRLVISG